MGRATPQPVPETPDHYGAYPRLSSAQVESLAAHGERRPIAAGDILFHEGDPIWAFHVILSGTVALAQAHGTDTERLIGAHGPGRFMGELNLLAGQPAFGTAVVKQAGEVLSVPVDVVRALVAHDLALGDLILRAFLIRRSVPVEVGASLRIIGSRYSPDARRIRDFAARNRLPYRWLDLERDATAETLLRQLDVSPQQTPVVILNGRQVLRNPGNAELAKAIGLTTLSAAGADFDLVVVGAGPAGLAASVYAASEGLSVAVLEAVSAGGQAGTSLRIENYPGFPAGISGTELAERAALQARKFGAELAMPASVVTLGARDGNHLIGVQDGADVSCRTVLIATGARYRRLDVPGMERFEKVSVYYAATVAEAQLYQRDAVAVVGGGNTAGQAAVFLAEHAVHVHLLVRHADLGRDMSRYLADRIGKLPNVTAHTGVEVHELAGRDSLEELVIADVGTGQRERVPVRALFVLIGADPRTPWLAGQLAMDRGGFLLTGGDIETGMATDPLRQPLPLETSRPGVFAAGDVRSGSVKRVASAVGEGAMVVALIHRHLNPPRA